MEKKSSKKNRVTFRWLRNRLLLPVLPWVGLIWLITVLVISNNSVVLKTVPMRANVVVLEDELKKIEKPGAKIPEVQKARAKLIMEYINKNQLVRAREQLSTYKNWLDTNPNLSLDDRIEMRKQLSLIYTTLGELEPAVKEYTLILQELAQSDDAQSKILKARFLNNRGVANFLLSQGSEKDELRKKYLLASEEDLLASRDLTNGTKSASGKENSDLEYLNQIVIDNENCLDLERTFTPVPSQP